MEKLVKHFEQIVDFKETIDVGDIVLIVIEEAHNALYAYVNSIERDESRRDEWWHISLSFLSIPIQQATWTLRTEQMTGQEIFTMGGKKRFVKAIAIDKKPSKPTTPPAKKTGSKGRVAKLRIVK